MKLITKAIEKAFEKQGNTSEKEMSEIKIICKLFSPVGAATWWLFEREDEDIFWCFANLGDPQCAEIGTVSLSELEGISLPYGLKIERDMHYDIGQETLEQVYKKVKQ